MRTSIFAIILVAGSAIAFQATARQQAAPSAQTGEQMHTGVDQQMQRNADKGIATRNSGASGYVADAQTGEQMHSGVDQQMQRNADKGIATRNSGASGYVADQDQPGASAHAPG
jgi:hypothetical protein